MKTTGVVCALAVLLSTAQAGAQERGRTDGPEGSEFGKGGYADPGGGRFSLELNWGAAVQDRAPGTPLFAGLTASFWGDDWFLIDVSGAYLAPTGTTLLLVGPRFRTAFYPVSGSLGLKAGAMFIPDFGVRFALSPHVGADVLLGDRVLLGLGYAIDIPVFTEAFLAHRIFMNVGYRF